MRPSKELNAAIESAFGMLAKDQVDVPIPMFDHTFAFHRI